LRITRDHDAELYCYGCRDWLPITAEFWPTPRFWRCKACESDRSKLYQARRAFDPEWRAMQIRKSIRYRAYIAGLDPTIAAAEAAERRELEAARQRATRANTEAERGTRAYKAAWQRVRRAEIKDAA
jgi:hypothetical protein